MYFSDLAAGLFFGGAALDLGEAVAYGIRVVPDVGRGRERDPPHREQLASKRIRALFSVDPRKPIDEIHEGTHGWVVEENHLIVDRGVHLRRNRAPGHACKTLVDGRPGLRPCIDQHPPNTGGVHGPRGLAHPLSHSGKDTPLERSHQRGPELDRLDHVARCAHRPRLRCEGLVRPCKQSRGQVGLGEQPPSSQPERLLQMAPSRRDVTVACPIPQSIGPDLVELADLLVQQAILRDRAVDLDGAVQVGFGRQAQGIAERDEHIDRGQLGRLCGEAPEFLDCRGLEVLRLGIPRVLPHPVHLGDGLLKDCGRVLGALREVARVEASTCPLEGEQQGGAPGGLRGEKQHHERELRPGGAAPVALLHHHVGEFEPVFRALHRKCGGGTKTCSQHGVGEVWSKLAGLGPDRQVFDHFAGEARRLVAQRRIDHLLRKCRQTGRSFHGRDADVGRLVGLPDGERPEQHVLHHVGVEVTQRLDLVQHAGMGQGTVDQRVGEHGTKSADELIGEVGRCGSVGLEPVGQRGLAPDAGPPLPLVEVQEPAL